MPRPKRTQSTKPPARQPPSIPRPEEDIVQTLAELEAGIITQDMACKALKLDSEQIVSLLDGDPTLETAINERAAALMLDPSIAHTASTKALNQASLALQRRIATMGDELSGQELAALMNVADKIAQISTAKAAEIKAEHSEAADAATQTCGGFYRRRLPDGKVVNLFFKMDPNEIHMWSDYGRLLSASGSLALEDRQALFERFLRSWFTWDGKTSLKSVCELVKAKPGMDVDVVCMGVVTDSLEHEPA